MPREADAPAAPTPESVASVVDPIEALLTSPSSAATPLATSTPTVTSEVDFMILLGGTSRASTFRPHPTDFLFRLHLRGPANVPC